MLMGMISMLLLLIILFVGNSPLKLSFLLMALSIWVAMMSLLSTSNLFPTSGMIISFSTGMMILFCYCASMVSFEKKNKHKTYKMVFIPLMLPLLTTEKMSEMTSVSTTPMQHQLQFLTVALSLVLLSMVGINKTMLNPSKSSMNSY